MTPATAEAQACGVDLGSEAVQTALNVQPQALPGTPWNRDPSNFWGNFDPCATLSVAITTIEGATGSSPDVAMLFNRGIYVGPATPTPHGFTSFNPAQTTDDTVALSYKTPGSCNACSDGTNTTVRYQWQELGPGELGHVVQLDPLP
ncbi:LppP/LprE family lipoprotein [Mycobacterium sp. NPDC051804]|uniref:LppP/LprE family lipoprotein n=1 Tax=Mycobacterium sp. NPDC051804 TaxID=3364295 RepID=UPI0037989926